MTISRDEAAACIDFDNALESYLDGADPEELLRAAVKVLGSAVRVEPERAEIIAAVTGCTCEIADYDDAGRAVRCWFDQMAEPGTRH
jgi:hypothetical protein